LQEFLQIAALHPKQYFFSLFVKRMNLINFLL